MNGTIQGAGDCTLRKSRFSRSVRSTHELATNLGEYIWVISFTFKYLPNIIREFCTHVAVDDTFSLSGSAAHVSKLRCRHQHTLAECLVCDRAQMHGVRFSQTGLPMLLSLSSSDYGTQIL